MSTVTTWLAFVGTYTWDESEGIYSYHVDSSTGDLRFLDVTPAGENPSFQALHPNGNFLYTVNETQDGSVMAFSIDQESGGLERLNQQPSGGEGPCHCSVEATGSYLMAAHYGDGTVSMLPIQSDGTLTEPSDVVKHEGSSVDPERQTHPRAHSIEPGPKNRFAYAPDLGADRVFVYKMDLEVGRLRPADQPYVEMHDQAGPRHIDFSPDGGYAYLLNEMDSTVTTFERDAETGALTELETTSTLPSKFDRENSTAEICVHPSGDWVYCSNRGHDTIAVFTVDDKGCLEPVGHESTRGETPRNFVLTANGSLLIAANQDTNDMYSFRTEGGDFTYTGKNAEIPRPVCIRMIPAESDD